MKRTPWFAGTVKPARPGVYERRFASGAIRFARWTGREWRVSAETVFTAHTQRLATALQTAPRWRGLAERPA
jgi:hypothetical protein